MSGNDPLDLIDGLTTPADVSKSETRAELLAAARGFPTAADVANWDLSGRSFIYIAQYQRFYAKDTSDTTTATSESLVRDINGLAFKVIDASGERVAFSAHNNSVDQTIASATPVALYFTTETFDEGGYFAGNTFLPPAGKYQLTACVAYTAGLVDQQLYGFYLYKNGAAFKECFKQASGTAAFASAEGSFVVEANGTDYFHIVGYADGAGTKTISGATAATFFSGFKIDGMKGLAGDAGATGATGPNVGLDYAFNTATSGDPGSGKVLVNNATLASVTQLNISETNRQAASQAAFLALQDDSTATSKCIIRIIDVAAPGTNFIDLAIIGTLTDAGTYDTFPVSYVGSAGTIANNAVVSVVFFRTGNNGTNGTNGTNGSNGTNGVSAPAVNFTFSTTTTDSDPGNGLLRYNNATVASVTSLYIDNLESGGGTVTSWLDAFDDASGTVKGILYINKASDPTKFAIFNVTGAVVDGTGYRKITVAHLASAGTFSNADAIQVMFSPAGVSTPATLPRVRPTLTTGVAITTGDVSGATSIYLTPCGGNTVPIYDGTNFVPYELSGDLTLALDATGAHTGYHQSGKIFDLFCIIDAGTHRFGTGPAWSSDTSRGTGAGTTELTLLKGIPVNANTIAIRFGSASGNTVSIAANKATYIGSFRATADGQATDSLLHRLLFSAYNQVQRTAIVREQTNNWTYSTSSFQQVRATATNQVDILDGLGTLFVEADAMNVVGNSSATARSVGAGIGLDSTTVNSGRSSLFQATSSFIATGISRYTGYPGLGYHYFAWLERGNATGGDTQTWYGSNSDTSIQKTGLEVLAFM